jgi:hypothetical protein
MWYRAIRGFVITSMVVNGALTIALITAMAAGVRPVSILDLAACAGLLFGFLNAVGDLVDAEYPVDHQGDVSSTAPVLHILRQRGETGGLEGADPAAIRLEGLEAFRTER